LKEDEPEEISGLKKQNDEDEEQNDENGD